MRWALQRSGRRLHLVDEVNGRPMLTALCGRSVDRWSITFNLPMGNGCRSCVRVARAANPSPRTYVVLDAA